MDDLLGELFGEVVLGRLSRSRRAQFLMRLFFGLLGAVLGVAGAVHFTVGRRDLTNSAMQATVIALVLFLACQLWPSLAMAGNRFRAQFRGTLRHKNSFRTVNTQVADLCRSMGEVDGQEHTHQLR